jgi:hypothetical protein
MFNNRAGFVGAVKAVEHSLLKDKKRVENRADFMCANFL